MSATTNMAPMLCFSHFGKKKRETIITRNPFLDHHLLMLIGARDNFSIKRSNCLIEKINWDEIDFEECPCLEIDGDGKKSLSIEAKKQQIQKATGSLLLDDLVFTSLWTEYKKSDDSVLSYLSRERRVKHLDFLGTEIIQTHGTGSKSVYHLVLHANKHDDWDWLLFLKGTRLINREQLFFPVLKRP